MSVTLTTILPASTLSTTPLFLATTQTPESLATTVSRQFQREAFLALRQELLDVAYLNPLKLYLRHHATKMELMIQQRKLLAEEKHPLSQPYLTTSIQTR